MMNTTLEPWQTADIEDARIVARQRRERERRDEEERHAKWLAVKTKMEAKLGAKREKLLAARAQEQGKAALVANEGPGWKVATRPQVPHEALEQLARNVIALAFHEAPLLPDWRFRWADLSGVRALGLCVPSAKLICVDEPLALAGSGALGRKMLLGTLSHEIAHALLPVGESHGEQFKRTLGSINDVVLADDDVAAAPAASASPRPELAKGVMFSGKRVESPGAGEWEFR